MSPGRRGRLRRAGRGRSWRPSISVHPFRRPAGRPPSRWPRCGLSDRSGKRTPHECRVFPRLVADEEHPVVPRQPLVDVRVKDQIPSGCCSRPPPASRTWSGDWQSTGCARVNAASPPPHPGRVPARRAVRRPHRGGARRAAGRHQPDRADLSPSPKGKYWRSAGGTRTATAPGPGPGTASGTCSAPPPCSPGNSTPPTSRAGLGTPTTHHARHVRRRNRPSTAHAQPRITRRPCPRPAVYRPRQVVLRPVARMTSHTPVTLAGPGVVGVEVPRCGDAGAAQVTALPPVR